VTYYGAPLLYLLNNGSCASVSLRRWPSAASAKP
jgi:hypothetical protein